MSKRRINTFRPGLERLEPKQPLSAGGATAPLAHHQSTAEATDAAVTPDVRPNHGFLVFRITQPNSFNNSLTLPMPTVLVQQAQPVPGQVYNVLSITVRNGTIRTFTAADNFSVKLSGQKQFTPILTGNEQWLPGQNIIFYVLTKKYYPIQNQVSGGFVFNLGAKSVAIPGPSGIFLRLKYNPATIARQLNTIVAFGQGAQGGAGINFGLPVTNIFEFLPSVTRRNDFGGYF